MAIGGDLIVELHRFRDGVGRDGWDGAAALDGLARVLVAAGQLEAASRIAGWASETSADTTGDEAV